MEHTNLAQRAIRVCLVVAVDKTDLLAEDDAIPYEYKASGQIEAIVRLVADSTIVISRRSAASLAPRLSDHFPGRRCLVLSRRLCDPPSCVHDDALLVQSISDVFAACVTDTLHVIGGPDLLDSFLPYASVLYKFVLDKTVRLSGGSRRHFMRDTAPWTSGPGDVGPSVAGPAGLFYHVEIWSLTSSDVALPGGHGMRSHFVRIRKPRRDFRIGFRPADDDGDDATSLATHAAASAMPTSTRIPVGSDAEMFAHIPDVGSAPVEDDQFASDMNQAIIQSRYEHWVESRQAQLATKGAASQKSDDGDTAIDLGNCDSTDGAVDHNTLGLYDADDFLSDVEYKDDDDDDDDEIDIDLDNDSTDHHSNYHSDADEDDYADDQTSDSVILYDGDESVYNVDNMEESESAEPAGCIVARLASCDPGPVWNILGRLRPADVFALARASPRLPRIIAAILDTLPSETINGAWRQPPDDPMWSVFDRDTTLSASVARVGKAWLMLVGMGARLWPMSPLQARFDPTLRSTAGTSDYWKQYVDPVVYASMLGSAAVVYECLWMSLQQDSGSDRLLPAVSLASAAASCGSLAIYGAARMAAAANALCGRTFVTGSFDRDAGYGGTLDMLQAVVIAYTRDLPLTEPHRRLSNGERASVLIEATHDFVNAVGADDDDQTLMSQEAFCCIDAICSRLSAWIVRHAATRSDMVPHNVVSEGQIDAAVATLGRIAQTATEQAAIGCTGIRGAVTVPLLRVLAATKDGRTDSVLLDALDMCPVDTAQPDAMVTVLGDTAPIDNLLHDLLDHEPMFFTARILPHLDDRDVLMLAICSRSLLHMALIWFADRRHKTESIGCVPLAVDHIEHAGPASEGLAIRCLWLPWISAALDLIERAVLACCPKKDQTAVEPHVVDRLIGALWRDVERPMALILAAVAHAVAVDALDVLPICIKALQRLERAHHQCVYVAKVYQLNAYEAAVIRHQGDARRAVSSRDPPAIRLLAWMQANTVLVDETNRPTADASAPDEDEMAMRNQIPWRHDTSAGNACSPITALAYVAGRLRSSRLLALAADMADDMARGALLPPQDVPRKKLLPFAPTSSGTFVPLYDHDQPPSLMDMRHAYLRAAALGLRHGLDPAVTSARLPSTGLFLDDPWERIHRIPWIPHEVAPTSLAEMVGFLLLTTAGGIPGARQIRSGGLAMLRGLP
jgi:hypothetical protein